MSFAPETYAALGAALVGLVWALVSRVKKAKRIMPRIRFRTHFSLETPSTDRPPSQDVEPLDVQIIPDEGTPREALSDRPTNPPPPRAPRNTRRTRS